MRGFLKRVSFPTGALILLGWFLWQGRMASNYGLEEWLVFYAVALLSWQPLSVWLTAEARWVPAAELFFLLHIPYYVTAFLRADEGFVILEPATRLKVGLVIALFLASCRFFYWIPHRIGGNQAGRVGMILDRTITAEWRDQVSWCALVIWCLSLVGLQMGWLPDFGPYFNTVRALIWSAGTIGMFVLYNELGHGRLTQGAKVSLLVLTALSVFFQLISGFLIYGALQMAMVFLAVFLGTKRLPLVPMLAALALFAFLQEGKYEMRRQFWLEGTNTSTASHNPLEVARFWVVASWNHLISPDDSDAEYHSLVERGNLLGFLSQIVSETPGFHPYLEGTTYAQTATIIVPRFLWPDKPKATTANETLAVYYGLLDEDSRDKIGIGMGRIGEGWANFGWAGILMAGAVMGLILGISTWLSAGYSPLHVRFLLSVPFVSFAMVLEECFASAFHALLSGLIMSFALLWVASVPTSAPAAEESSESRLIQKLQRGASR